MLCYRCGLEHSGGVDELIACDYCDNWIHQKCFAPPLASVPKGKFRCLQCLEKFEAQKKKKAAAAAQRAREKKERELANVDRALTTRSGRAITHANVNNPSGREIQERRRTHMERMAQ